ncbi:MAG: DUF4040 domain-containing protein [Idiomarina sp.]|nr:DUF4040 domain-containing protein [Idiomarina sp.]
MNLAFDIVLGLALLLTALGVFSSKDLFRAVVMFIAFGLLLALVWVRLDAPDLALAEAAIGAGLTGVLMIDAVAHLSANTLQNDQRDDQYDHSPKRPLWLPVISCVGLFVLLLGAIRFRPEASVSLPDMVRDNIAESGVEHPITAVLLNFRSYDTLLEIAVLLVAVVVAMALKPAAEDRVHQPPPAHDPILHGLTARLLPAMLLVGMYVLWAGSYMPGGAFQGGAILAAALVFLQLAGFAVDRYAASLLRLGLALGFLVFLTVAVSVMIGGRPFLTYPEGFAGQLIFFIEAMLTLSIGLILFSLFSQNPPHSGAVGHQGANHDQ